MSVYFISGGIVLAHFIYKHNTHITNYIHQKIIDYRVSNLQTNMFNLHDIIDSLEHRLMEKQTQIDDLHKLNDELKNRLSELDEKISHFIQTNYEFVNDVVN